MTVELNDLLGDWQATSNVPTYMGFSAFTIPKGAIVAVKQQDSKNRKVLVEAGPSSIDWKHKNFLQLFERVT